jgi:hypothetical protein
VLQYLNDLSEIGKEQCWEKGSNLGFVVMNPKTIFGGHRNNFDIAWNNMTVSECLLFYVTKKRVFLLMQVDNKSLKFSFFFKLF